MHLERAGEGVSGLPKVVQDLIAPELGSIKATQAAHSEQFTLIRTELKASEERTREAAAASEKRLTEAIEAMVDRLSEKMESVRRDSQGAVTVMGDRLSERIEFARKESQEAVAAMGGRLGERIEFARSEAQHSANEIKLLIGLNYEQRKREEAEARIAELERRLQLQAPS